MKALELVEKEAVLTAAQRARLKALREAEKK
jgi:hypothetical protein